MIMSFVFAIFAPIGLGFLVMSFVWQESSDLKNMVSVNFLKILLGIGFGFGIVSCGFFVWLVFFGNKFILPNYFIFESAMIIILLIKARKKIYLQNSYSANVSLFLDFFKGRRHLESGFFLFVGITLILSAIYFLGITAENPHGGWDAWAFWNMRARMLFRGVSHWRDSFSNLCPPWLHPDYPALLPVFIARCWMCIGNDSLRVPAIVAMFFTFSTAGLLFFCINFLRGRMAAYLAVLVLLTGSFVKIGASQYADIPVAFYFLSCLGLFCLHDKFIFNYRILWLAGVMAGLSAWTKNEGIVFSIIVMISRLVLVVISKGWKNYRKELNVYLVGFFPIFLIVAYFKVFISTPNHFYIENLTNWNLLFLKLTDPHRYFLTLKFFIESAIENSQIFGVSLVFILTVFLAFNNINIQESARLGIWTNFMVIFLMISAYFFVMVTTPDNLLQLLLTTPPRLFCQIWPSALLIFFLSVRMPMSFNEA